MGGGCFFCPTGFEGRTVQSNLPVDGCDRERPRRGYAEPRPNPVGWAYPRLNLSRKRCRFRYPVRRHHERSGQCSRNDSLYAAVLTKSKRKYNMINNLWTKTISYFRLNIEWIPCHRGRLIKCHVINGENYERTSNGVCVPFWCFQVIIHTSWLV